MKAWLIIMKSEILDDSESSENELCIYSRSEDFAVKALAKGRSEVDKIILLH